MVSAGTSSLLIPPQLVGTDKQSTRKNGDTLTDAQKLHPLVFAGDNRLEKKLTQLAIPVAMVATSLDNALKLDIATNKPLFAFLDYAVGADIVIEFLNLYARSAPHISTIVIDGPAELINQGASDCIPLDYLNWPRLEIAVLHATRLRQLQQQLPVPANSLHASHAFDHLTSLVSRPNFKSALKDVTKQTRKSGGDVSLIVLDIDNFKGLNESKGHKFGDQILSAIAERLIQFAPEQSIIGRMGDDEFSLLLQGRGLSKVSDTTIAARLSHELRQPYYLDGQATTLSATMGIAKLEKGDGPDSFLHKAVSALYTAKRDKNRFMVYTKQEDIERRQRLKLSQELPEAIDANQLRLHYQPMIRMHDSTVIGVEALVRWQHPQKGLLFPDNFIPLAEGSGSIEPLTRWVLDASIKQGAEWMKSGKNLTVSVNISALILHNPIFPDIVNRLLEQSGFPANLLKLEITESAIISDVVRATDVVNRLHDLGVKVSIDDFGTGYTSLAYIRKLPVDEIKIDKSFVLNMNTVSDDAVIVRTLLELARNLDLSVVAEGVEDRETWYMLAGLGCHVAQGYYMSRPIEKETLEGWLTSSPWAIAN